MTTPTATQRMRLDQLLVERCLFESRSRARDAVMRGTVSVAGAVASKPGLMVPADADLAVADAAQHYVSRAALKLLHGLDHFGLDPRDSRALDIGASTGGFTQVLLERGAAKVYAVDVGTAQLHQSLHGDPRIVSLEQTDIRKLDAALLDPKPDLIVCDVSFISVTLILPAAAPLLRPSGQMVILIKPQFEVGRGQVGKGGIVREPELHQAACEKVERAVREFGFITTIIESPIRGAEGNKEFLLYAHH